VDIGFVDFGIAFDSVDSIDETGEPLTVLGYEMEPHCIAKTKYKHDPFSPVTKLPRTKKRKRRPVARDNPPHCKKKYQSYTPKMRLKLPPKSPRNTRL
jgi:hypothetical protein